LLAFSLVPDDGKGHWPSGTRFSPLVGQRVVPALRSSATFVSASPRSTCGSGCHPADTGDRWSPSGGCPVTLKARGVRNTPLPAISRFHLDGASLRRPFTMWPAPSLLSGSGAAVVHHGFADGPAAGARPDLDPPLFSRRAAGRWHNGGNLRADPSRRHLSGAPRGVSCSAWGLPRAQTVMT
jgi:hypothetical protein